MRTTEEPTTQKGIGDVTPLSDIVATYITGECAAATIRGLRRIPFVVDVFGI